MNRAVLTVFTVTAAVLTGCSTSTPGAAVEPARLPVAKQTPSTPATPSTAVTPVVKPTVQPTPDTASVVVPAVTGPTAREVVDAFITEGLRAPNPRDNSRNCTGDGGLGCVQLITTDSISVYSWPTEATARHQAEVHGEGAYRKGLIVLSYTGARTPKADRPKYEAVLNELTGS